VLDAYELAVRRARKKYHGLPYVIWRETTPQHFPGPGGDGQYPAVDYWYMRGACAPHNYSYVQTFVRADPIPGGVV
jgi:hypothetical protein